MSDLGDGEYLDYGDDWIYVEDYWDEANELAEHTCPSPMPYAEHDVEEYDVHDYWQDIEYISDGGYYEDHRTPIKRKMDANSSPWPTKRRLKASASNAVGPISWMTQLQRYQTQYNAPLVAVGNAQSTALLKDWDRRFKDSPGLASLPKPDSEMEETEQPVSGDGFDLSDLKSVAGLLSKENIGTLQEILKAKGLDPSAVEEVLQDLIDGNERSFENEEDLIEDESYGNEEQEDFRDQGEQLNILSTEEMPETVLGDTSSAAHGRRTSSALKQSPQGYINPRHPGPPRGGSKRKGALEDGDVEDSDDGPSQRRKRQKDKDYAAEADKTSHDSPLHISRVTVPENPPVHSRASRSTPVVPKDDVRRTRSGRARRR